MYQINFVSKNQEGQFVKTETLVDATHIEIVTNPGDDFVVDTGVETRKADLRAIAALMSGEWNVENRLLHLRNNPFGERNVGYIHVSQVSRENNIEQAHYLEPLNGWCALKDIDGGWLKAVSLTRDLESEDPGDISDAARAERLKHASNASFLHARMARLLEKNRRIFVRDIISYAKAVLFEIGDPEKAKVARAERLAPHVAVSRVMQTRTVESVEPETDEVSGERVLNIVDESGKDVNMFSLGRDTYFFTLNGSRQTSSLLWDPNADGDWGKKLLAKWGKLIGAGAVLIETPRA